MKQQVKIECLSQADRYKPKLPEHIRHLKTDTAFNSYLTDNYHFSLAKNYIIALKVNGVITDDEEQTMVASLKTKQGIQRMALLCIHRSLSTPITIPYGTSSRQIMDA